MRLSLLTLFLAAVTATYGKSLHIHYVVVAPSTLTAEERTWLPQHWDLYLSEYGYRLVEVGGLNRLWVGQIDADESHLLLSFLGESIDLVEPCIEATRWTKGTPEKLPTILAESFALEQPAIAGMEAQAFHKEGQWVWLTAERTTAPCFLDLPRLPLAFPLPESPEGVWLLATDYGAHVDEVSFAIPDGYRTVTREDLGTLIPLMHSSE